MKLTNILNEIKSVTEGVHSFAAMSATKAALKKKKKEGVSEEYKGNMSDFGIDLANALDNIGISPKAIKKISKKGKGFEVRMSSYMSNKDTWEKLGKEMGAKLVDFKKGTINIGLYESTSRGITEAGLKGTEKIPSTKKLSQLSDNEKLTIVQSSGNIISFHIPDWAKGRYKNWQVISAGKVKKNKDLDGEIIYFLPGKGPQKASPTYKSVKDLLNGVDWDTMELRRESVNESNDDKQKVVDYLVKKGNNKNDAQKMVNKNYDFVSKRYKGASVVKKAEIISGLQEGLFSDIMRGVKKGSSPYSLVVIENNKVVKQIQVKEDKAIPAHFNTLKKEYPNSRIRVESSTGQILFEK